MRISDWSSDVCSSDLSPAGGKHGKGRRRHFLAPGSHPRRSAGADDIRTYAYAVLISSSILRRAALAQPCGEPFTQAARIIDLVGEQALWRRHRATGREQGRERECHYVNVRRVNV